MLHEKKKKNGTTKHLDRNLLIAVMSFGVLMLLFGFLVYYSLITGCTYGADFPETTTAIVATNNAVATLLEGTDLASTIQASFTETPLP
jgi:hypothetical protein